VFPVEARAKSLPYENRAVRVTALRDISERKRLEEHVRQSQKMESLGLLAGGVAHDFNNILNIIMGNASLIAAAPHEREKLDRRIEAITKATDRGARVVHQLLAFARKTELQRRPLIVNDMIWETCKLLEETFPKTIEVAMELRPDLPIVEGDANQLQQVLLNLSVNARDAMPNGGRLTVVTTQVSRDSIQVRFPGADAARYVAIMVADTGVGMEESVRLRVFDPFFTTKDIGKGTGLGLAVALGIVERHGGFIDVESWPGRGTEFRIYLPSADFMGGVEEEPAQNAAAAAGGTETVLFVEDELLSREMIRDLLEQKGYTVLLAADGEEAVRMYHSSAEKIDLVVTDLGLPRADGEYVCREIRRVNPSVPIAVASGFVDPDRRKRLQDLGVEEVIMKPYRLGTMLTRIRTLLDARSGR
jgi:nitrogen-specific signal transduction histidine kinase